VKERGITSFLLFVITLFSLEASPLAAQTAGGSDAARAQADAFIAQADAALASGSLQQARSLLASAFELSPDYSEALYRRARIAIAELSGTQGAIDDLRASLRMGTWKATAPSVVQQDLAEVLLRTGSFAEARTLLDPLVAAHPEDPRNLLLLARVSVRAGDRERESRVCADAVLRFPLVDEFRLLSSALFQRQGRLAAARAVIATGLSLHPDSLELLLEAARLEGDRKKRLTAVELYFGRGGRDPLSAVLALEASPKDRKKYLDLFLSLDGLTRQDLVDRTAAAVRGNTGLSRTLQSALTGFSGTRDLDRDADGFWEDRWFFDKGRVTGWRREPTQDGVARYSAGFSDRGPSTFMYALPTGVPVTLTFSRYPFIDSATTTQGARLFLVPYTLQCEFLQPAAGAHLAGTAPRIAERIAVPDPDTLRKDSFREERYAADGTTVVRRTGLSSGPRVFMEEDTDGDGVFDHRVWYVNGSPSRGERALTGNGLFQVRETWRDGKLEGASFDSDGNGKVEYRETYGVHPMKSWDYDEDGRDDCRESPGPGGAVLREFATSRNGVFDLRLSWREGRITHVAFAGRTVQVMPDPERGVTWIGLPPASGARPDLALHDGFQMVDGREYLIFRYGGVVYAEGVK
jgi:tetratricopeptide (TPR) repeat protein